MADFSFGSAAKPLGKLDRPWWRELNRYHWFVLLVAALGWMFDCLDQQLFALARAPAMAELLKGTGLDVNAYSGYVTAVFLMGWASGGIIFGIMGDRVGRAKTMMITILIYSACTGLSALSYSVYDFAAYRFITGLGVGGEFAVGVSLVAEVMPELARPYALGLLQALSAIGNVSSAVISLAFAHLEREGVLGRFHLFGTQLTAWRAMFLVGALPALLAVAIRRHLKEPERWQAAVKSDPTQKSLGSFRELFGNPVWRRRAIGGMLLACAGVIALWGIGFFSGDFTRSLFRSFYDQQARDHGDAELDRQFVASLVARPESIEKLPTDFKPSYLLSPIAAGEQSSTDAVAVYGAIRSLHDDRESISKSAVLDWLDKGDSAHNRLEQSSGQRVRRAAYLDGTAADPEQIAAHAQRIVARGKAVEFQLSLWAAISLMLFNIGGFFGVYGFSYVAQSIGRRTTFAIAFTAAMLSTALVFGFLSAATMTVGGVTLFRDVFWMMPLMGFFQLSIFGGYAIYFPELFPTRLRSTGTSFCYNVGRFVAAVGPYTLGLLASEVYQHTDQPLRWSGLTMCSIFLLGLAVVPFMPETKGQPLPE